MGKQCFGVVVFSSSTEGHLLKCDGKILIIETTHVHLLPFTVIGKCSVEFHVLSFFLESFPLINRRSSTWHLDDHEASISLVSPWWRHQMETFSALLAICPGNSPVPGEFPAQRPVTRRFDVFFDLRLNKRLRKQLWGWWFETLSRPLWRHCKALILLEHVYILYGLLAYIVWSLPTLP